MIMLLFEVYYTYTTGDCLTVKYKMRKMMTLQIIAFTPFTKHDLLYATVLTPSKQDSLITDK